MVALPLSGLRGSCLWSGLSRSPAETDRIGHLLATHLSPGDVVTLDGPLGAGKSHLARAMVRTLLDDPSVEVPSPSYTLVNVYQGAGVEIWHADLYRIADGSELDEIGLEDALESGILLVEWAARWPDLPAEALRITIEPRGDDSRALIIASAAPRWQALPAALEARA